MPIEPGDHVMKTEHMTIVRILPDVRPFGGRCFLAKRDEHGRWAVDVKSDARQGYNPANTAWAYRFGGYSDWRTYKDHEVEVIGPFEETTS
tara:strand:- start:114 stop:386 length:273 start_codon:yes stop_codon:yes gene_type:complete